MDIMQAMQERHSVRSYTGRPVEAGLRRQLEAEIEACNAESGLHIQSVFDEPQAFRGMMAHFGKFSGVQNYIALIGKKDDSLDETAGYYGERLALRAQQLGLNTCWVAMTYRKGKARCRIGDGEKLLCVLALGYGTTQGTAHKSKPMDALCTVNGPMPDWFRRGMEAAMLAPTATNQQKFCLTLEGDAVKAVSTGGFYSRVDLGIVKYHFEQGAGKDAFRWA